MISGEAKYMDVDECVTVSRAALKELQEATEDKWYWKGRAEGLEYAMDALQSVFELILKGRD